MIQNYNQPDSYKGLEVDQQAQKEGIFFTLITKVGSMGRYQIFLFLTLSAISLICGSVILITPFLFYEDKYDCDKLQVATDTYKQCLDIICEQYPLEARTQFFPDVIQIHSFANKFGDYRCPKEQANLDLIKSFFYFGQLLSFFGSSIIGDLIRTKVLVIGGMMVSLVGIIILSFSDVFWFSIVGLFIIPVGIITSYNLTYIFITEMVVEHKRQTYKIIVASIFSVGALTNVLWFLMIPNYEIVMLVFFGLPMLIIMIIFIVFFKDTPISLITKNTPQKAYKSLMHIARINGIQNPGITVEQVRQIQERYKRQNVRRSVRTNKAKRFTFIDLFRYSSMRRMTITLIFVDCVFVLQWLTPTLMLNQFNFNVFVSGAVIESASVMVGIFGYFTIYKIPRRMSGMVSFGIIMACSIVLIFVWNQDGGNDEEVGSNVVVLLFVFIIELVVSNAFNVYGIYLNQLFPTQIRVIGLNFIKTWGSLTSMVSSQIINACLNSGFPIMLVFAVLAAASIILSYFLPESHGKRPPEMIPQLESASQGSEKTPVKINNNEKYHAMVDEQNQP